MAPSFISTLSSALLLTSSAVSAHQSYQLADSYDSTNFLEKFGFFVSDHTTGNYNDVDPTGGYVSYKSAEEAQSKGLLKTVDGDLYLGVDAESVLDPNGIGRSSVRIESKAKYKQGLFVADFSHFPKPTCGTWPAFWTVGEPWPSAGEIDIVETWNEDGVNKVVIHTDSDVGECRIDGKNMTGTVSKPNCANFAPGQADNEGCAGLDSSPPFGSPEGGIYAMEWTDTAVRVWGFTHANAPADIAAPNPKPETWGTPSFTTSACEADKVFAEAKMVMNIDFCGVAGNDGIWDQSCQAKTGGVSCHEWVAKNPAAFADVYFRLKSINIYSLKEGEAVPSPGGPGSSSSSSAASTIAAVPSSAVVSSSAAPASSLAHTSGGISSDKPAVSGKPTESTTCTTDEAAAPTTTTTTTKPGAVEPPSATASASASEKPAPSGKPVETPTAASDLTTRLATSTVYATNVKTVTSCASTVTNCPAKQTPVVVTEVVPVTTTVCPVVDIPTSLTVSKTKVVTVTSCPPAVADCPVGKETTTVTGEIIYTTIPVPVSELPPSVPTGVVPVNPPAPGVPGKPSHPGAPGPDKPSAPGAPGAGVPETPGQEQPPTPAPGVPETPGQEQPPTPVPGVPETPGQEQPPTPVPGVPETPGQEQPPAPAPGVPETPGQEQPPAPAPGIPPAGETTIAQQPTPVTPGAPGTGVATLTTPAAQPTPIIPAPSSPYNGTLTTVRVPTGTGVPCIGAACPAAPSAPIQAGAGKLSAGAYVLAAAVVLLVI